MFGDALKPGADVVVVAIYQKAKMDLVAIGVDVDVEKDRLLEQFNVRYPLFCSASLLQCRSLLQARRSGCSSRAQRPCTNCTLLTIAAAIGDNTGDNPCGLCGASRARPLGRFYRPMLGVPRELLPAGPAATRQC